MGVSESREYPLGGPWLRGFYSAWGIKGVPLFWEMPTFLLLLELAKVRGDPRTAAFRVEALNSLRKVGVARESRVFSAKGFASPQALNP